MEAHTQQVSKLIRMPHLEASSLSKAGTGILKCISTHWPRRREMEARQVHKDISRLSYGLDATGLKPSHCCRIVALGARRVGKSCILRRFLGESFEEHYEPTTEDFLRKIYQIHGDTFRMDILDAPRERDFPAKRRLSILTGDVFLLVFSLDDRSSFTEACALLQEVMAAKSKSPGCKENEPIPMVICGNKADVSPNRRAVSHTEVNSVFGKCWPVFETSAKEGTNLWEMFATVVKQGGLPVETGPLQHRSVSIRSYHALHAAPMPCRLRSVAFGAYCPAVRRPSFSTELQHVLQPKSSQKHRIHLEKCQIQ